MAATMTTVLSVAALAIDVGLVYTARTEAQRVADLSALAGAGSLARLPENDGLAGQIAIQYAQDNSIRHQAVILDPADVQVDRALGQVTVTVLRTANRGNPVNTLFAGLFGVSATDVVATATAEAMDIGSDVGVTCPLPIALPDRWREEDGTWSDKDDTFDAPGDYYDPQRTGYTESNIGDQVFLRQAGGGGGNMANSWYFPWTPFGDENALLDDGSGGKRYRERISGCMKGVYTTGTVVYSEPGAMSGPTDAGFKELYDLDPSAYWNQFGGPGGCVARPTAVSVENPHGCVDNSPRVKNVPLFDPTVPAVEGRKEFTITKVASIFVEGRIGSDYYGRWLGTTGTATDASVPGNSSIVKALRLIK